MASWKSVVNEVLVKLGRNDAGTRKERMKQFNLLMPKFLAENLGAIAKKEGVGIAEIARRAMVAYVDSYQHQRRQELARIAGLSEDLSRQAVLLFSQLPEDEISDDEPLLFGVNEVGEIIIRVERTEAQYYLFQGCAVRLAATDDKGEMVIFKGGEEIERKDFALSEMTDWIEK